MLNDKIFCFIDSLGRHVQKNSKSRMRSWWWPLSIQTPVLGIDRGRVSLLADSIVKEDLKCSGLRKIIIFIFCVFKVLQCIAVIWLVYWL